MLNAAIHHRAFRITFILGAVVFLLVRCVQNDKAPSKKENSPAFAGSASCNSCHADIAEQHEASFHHLTSAPASLQTIKGSFAEGQNTFYFNPGLYITVEKSDSQLLQTAYQQGVKKLSRPFDIVVGSGKRGQTFLYWKDHYLFQLPLSYFTSTNEWTNSPGYSNRVQFNRPVTARCLECHSTWFKQEHEASEKADMFSRDNVILGVECEKCHGPASEHVSYHQKNPQDSIAKYIISPGRFTRAQSLDLCRYCHGGRLTKTTAAFSYKPGEKLGDYFDLSGKQSDISEIDVHGNQYGMMSASKCFLQSDMTCMSCHDAHKNQSKDLEAFTISCLKCHGEGKKTCKLSNSMDAHLLQQNCIDCHMPEEPSKAIMVLRQGETVPTSAVMRSHYIAVHPDAAKRIMEMIKKSKK